MSSRSAMAPESPKPGAVRNAVRRARAASSSVASSARGSRVARAQPWNAVGCGDAGREHDEMTETEALLGDPSCQVALELREARRRPALDALVEGDLSTMAIEIADNAHELGWAIEGKEPLQNGRAPARVSLAGRRSAGAFQRQDAASTPGLNRTTPASALLTVGKTVRCRRGRSGDRHEISVAYRSPASRSPTIELVPAAPHLPARRWGGSRLRKSIETPGADPDAVPHRRGQREAEHHHRDREADPGPDR